MERIHLVRGFEPTFPNYLTVLRMIAGGLLFSVTGIYWLLDVSSMLAVDFATALMVLGAATDMDGSIARYYNCVTKWGTYWDSIADAILTGCAAASIYFFKEHTELEVAILFLIIGRESWRPFAQRINGTDDLPKFEFERTKQVVYFVACCLVVSRGSHVEMWWDALALLSWFTLGTITILFAGCVMVYAYHGTRERERAWRRRKKQQIKDMGKRARTRISLKISPRN